MHKTLAFKVTHLRTTHRIPYYQQLITVIPSILKSLTLDQHYNSLTHGILSNTFYIHPKCILHAAQKQLPRENLLHIQNRQQRLQQQTHRTRYRGVGGQVYWRDLRALEIQVLEPDLGPTKTLNMTFCASRSNWTHAALREGLAERDAACLVFGVLGDLRSRFFFFFGTAGQFTCEFTDDSGRSKTTFFSLFS